MTYNKYKVAPKEDRTYKGVVYDSKLEMKYRQKLDLFTMASIPKEKVVRIEEQVPYSFIINGKLICKYLLDFRVTYADGHIEYIDCKGMKTDIYQLKKKLMGAIYPKVKIQEVTKVK